MTGSTQVPPARALIITTNYPRWKGDPHSPWLVTLLRLLREQGVGVEVLAPAFAGQDSHTIDGIPVHRFRYAPARYETLTHEEGAPNKIRRQPAYLVEAMPLLLQRHPEARLVIVGEGHERPQLEELIRRHGLADRVTLAGRVSDAELQHDYATCDIFVLPAIADATGDTEMLGMVSLQAMAYRKPVVATDVGGIPDIVHHGETGLLVPQRDPAALAAAIEQLLDDRDLARRLGRAGYAFARDRFGWPVVAETLAHYDLAPDGHGI